MSDRRVLCVENRPEYMRELKLMLETAGYQVLAATRADQALHLLKTREVDGVLLDTICRMRPELPCGRR